DRYPEQTMVDGLVELSDRTVGVRAVREIEVRKFRGGPHIRGLHILEIDRAGATVYPRIEALAEEQAPAAVPPKRLRFGVKSLDAMVRGGLPSGTTTLIFGTPGTRSEERRVGK